MGSLLSGAIIRHERRDGQKSTFAELHRKSKYLSPMQISRQFVPQDRNDPWHGAGICAMAEARFEAAHGRH
ncbi:MAG: hypothetical protein O9256_00045 [Rhizobiaceae bacterium]|nr:hypothetical protein [Rhizobiaceae bacterium]